ncbi:MAG: hypothetical protein ACODAU_00270 [Myxococcota bacterium]
MRSTRARVAVLAVLASAAALQAGAFVQKAYACEPMRTSPDEEPDCCQTGSQTRWTAEGGDCCVRLVLEEGDPTAQASALDEVSAAGALVLPPPSARMPAPRPVWTGRWHAYERGPPLPVPTETVVLLN